MTEAAGPRGAVEGALRETWERLESLLVRGDLDQSDEPATLAWQQRVKKALDALAARADPGPGEDANEHVGRAYRKRPAVIEAVQWTGANVDEVEAFADPYGVHNGKVVIQTREGVMVGEVGDWIIKGVKGEFYPCKPDIFAATYEPVTAGSPPPPGVESAGGDRAETQEVAEMRAERDALAAQLRAVEGALRRLVQVINAAGLDNLTRGVQLGQMSWRVKAGDAMDDAVAALRAPAQVSPDA